MEIIYPRFCYCQEGLLGYDPSEEQSCSEEKEKTKFKPNGKGLGGAPGGVEWGEGEKAALE